MNTFDNKNIQPIEQLQQQTAVTLSGDMMKTDVSSTNDETGTKKFNTHADSSIKASLRNRFIIYMGSLFLLLSIIAGFVYYSLQQTNKDFNIVTDEKLLQLRKLVYLQDLISRSSTPVYHYLASPDPTIRAEFWELVAETEQTFFETLGSMKLTSNQYGLLKKTYHEWQQGITIGKRLLSNPVDQNRSPNPEINIAFYNHIDDAVGIMYQVHNINLKQIEDYRSEADQNFKLTRKVTLVGFFTVVLTFIAGIFAISRLVLKPAQTLLKGIHCFGRGELEHRVSIKTNDEFGALGEGFNRMAENLERNQEILAELAVRDSLTGLYNRRKFESMLSDEINRFRRNGSPISLLVIDLDHFKQVNDRHGHQAGDEALKTAADIITNHCRTGDIIGRYGGEELVALLPETNIENSIILAERVCYALAEFPITISSTQAIPVTASIGVATVPNHAMTARDLITAADLAMYEAKNAGRNQVKSA